MSFSFAQHAAAYWERRLSVIPIEPGTKAPAKELVGWPGYLSNLPNPETRKDWCKRLGHYGLGLLLGDEVVRDYVLVGVDVDDDALVAVTEAIIGSSVSAKVGKKGRTFFVIVPKLPKLKSTQLRDSDKKGKIDILASGKMTVLPPSLHPETGEPYRWVGTPLTDCNLDQLPQFDLPKVEILRVVVGSAYSKAIMTGTATHDPGVVLAAQLVAAGAEDAQITAIFKALLPAAYAGNSLEELSEWIASARRKGFDKGTRIQIDDQVAGIIEEDLRPIHYVPGDGFLHYADGFWNEVSNSEIDRRAKYLLASMLPAKRPVHPMLSNVRGCLALNVEAPGFGQEVGRICVRNGTLNVTSGELEPHSPDHQLRFRLEIDYDPAAACPTYEEQLEQTFNGDTDSIRLFDEFVAHTLVPEMRFQKALYLMGPGGSGKSTLLHVAEMIHDPRAVSATPLVRVEDERYLTDLVRKLICISYDIQTDRKVFGEHFVRITGGDPVATRRLYQEVEGRVIPTVRFIGSMNEDMPRFIAAPDALERRLIILRCAGAVKQPDRSRVDKLRNELPGILVRLVEALQRLYARGGFDIPEASHVELTDYVHMQDSFDLFVSEKLMRDPSARTPIAEIAREYNWWAEQAGAEQLKVNVIGRKLRRAGFDGAFARMQVGEGSQNQRIVHARIRGAAWRSAVNETSF